MFGGQDRFEKQGAALDFVKGLCLDWAAQRGGLVLSDAELAELAHLVKLLLRHMPRSEARELLTTQVASADDLSGVLRWRIGRALAQYRRAARRVARLRVDDDGTQHEAFLAANDARNAANAGRRAELVALARSLARRTAEPRLEDEWARLEARSVPSSTEKPSEARSGSRPPSRGDGTNRGAIDSPGRLRGATEPEEIFQRDVIDRHRLPGAANPDISPEPGGQADAAAAADRAWLIEIMRGR